MAQASQEQPPLTAEALFDDVGPAYEDAFAGLQEQYESLEWLLSQIESIRPAKILDIGCGTGKPVCKTLSAAGHEVLGIDISGSMLAAAKANVPEATFEKIDIAQYDPGTTRFDAITVYFSIIAGVSQDDIRTYINKIYNWLRPGGLLVFATLPVDLSNVESKWMGRRIVVSGLDANELLRCFRKEGFEIVQSNISTFVPKGVEAGLCEQEDIWEETHIFVYGRKKD